MDIWQWVADREISLLEAGEFELANYINDIPSHAVNNRFDLVDQTYHAALPLCRALDDKWLEVYFRHWRLQAHVLKNYDAKGMLNEAVSLLDFAHGVETKNCPQRVCTVQDLASCYGIKDGPGYVEERISVCRETLAQIDGSWPCYECVSSELLGALLDKKDYEQAEVDLGFIESEINKVQGKRGDELAQTRTRILLGRGQFEAAWLIIKDTENPAGGEAFAQRVELLKAVTLCYMGRWKEANEICLPFDDVVKVATYYSDWTKIQMMLQRAGIVKNDRELRYKFHRLVDKLIRKDALRIAFDIGERLIDLCISADEKLRADYMIQTMRTLREGFHRDIGASEILENLERRIGEISVLEITESLDTVEAVLKHQFETETQEFYALAGALERWPDEGQIYARKVDLFRLHCQEDDAYQLLETAYMSQSDSALLEGLFGSAYLAKHGFEAYQSKFPVDQLDELSPEKVWSRGFIHIQNLENQDPAKTLEVLKIIENHWPENIELLGLIARQEQTLKNYDAAIAYRRRQIELDPENLNHKWNLLIIGTLNEHVPLVREMAAFLKIELDENGHYPADRQNIIRLQWEMSDGLVDVFHAVRLGPALARVISICSLYDADQLHGRIVVFDPSPLNELNQKDDEGYPCDIDGNHDFLYPPPLLTLTDPDYKTYTIDGIHPGEDALKTLFEKINAAGFIYDVRSIGAYELDWQEGQNIQTRSAIYIYCLVQSGQEDALNDLLVAFNRGLEHPLVWIELTLARGDEVLRLEQQAIMEKYRI